MVSDPEWNAVPIDIWTRYEISNTAQYDSEQPLLSGDWWSVHNTDYTGSSLVLFLQPVCNRLRVWMGVRKLQLVSRTELGAWTSHITLGFGLFVTLTEGPELDINSSWLTADFFCDPTDNVSILVRSIRFNFVLKEGQFSLAPFCSFESQHDIVFLSKLSCLRALSLIHI